MSDSPVVRKRGRPLGTKNGQGFTQRWVPLEWDPIYDQMIALSITGMTNAVVGLRLGYTAQQVSNILNTPEAKLIKQRFSEHIKKNTEISLSDLKNIATKRLADVLTNDDLAEAAPFRMFDAAAKLLSGVGALSDGSDKVITNVINIPSEHVDRLAAAFAKSDEARRLNAGPPITDS